MPTVAELFVLALQYHQAGNPRQAEQLYHQVLQADPAHAETHNLLGVLACQSPDRLDEAVTHFRQALHWRPDFPEAHNNLGNAFLLKDDLDEAAAQYHQALRLRSPYADALCNLGSVLLRQDKLDEALRCYQQALAAKPNSAEVCNNLGLVFERQDKLDEAICYYRQALRLNPDYADAHRNLGNALFRQEKLDEALGCYQQAFRLNPNSAQTCNNLGLALQHQEKLDEASRCYRQALQLKPDYAEAHSNLGNVLVRLEKLDEAAACYRQALRLNPNIAEAHNGLGCALQRQDQLDEAIRCFQEALRHRPNFPEAYSNLGNALVWRNELEEGSTCFEQALRLDPDFVSARWNRSFLWLLRGDFERGWPEYEWRWGLPGAGRRHFAQPRWDGLPLGGRTILLHAEQGQGDTLQFIRYLPLVKQGGGKVIVECQPPLLRLLANVPEIDDLLSQGSALPPFDVQAPLLSLPGILHTGLASIPAPVPYLHADTELTARWRWELRKSRKSEVGSRKSEVRTPKSEDVQLTSDIRHPTSDFLVGIAWQGSPKYRFDRRRSIALTHFRPLAQVPGVKLISLQKGPGTEQLSALEQRVDSGQWTVGGDAKTPSTVHRPPFTVHHLGSRLDEASGAFMDTAAIMKSLDLVISCDTVIPHLAGALGVPVWVALPLVPDWRWLLEREDSPWYPTMRLFRQTRYGQWEDVFERMAEEMKARFA